MLKIVYGTYYAVCMAETVTSKSPRLVKIGERIAELRGRMNMSQEQFAARVSRLSGRRLSRVTLAQYETGAVEAPVTRIVDVANALNVHTGVITGDKPYNPLDVAFQEESLTSEEREEAIDAAMAYIEARRKRKHRDLPVLSDSGE